MRMMENRKEETEFETLARNFFCGYQLAMDLLNLRKYERKRGKRFEEEGDCEDVMNGCEADWRERIDEVRTILMRMKNGREKTMLYYHYVKQMSVERIADIIGVSRRSGYRIHKRALIIAGSMISRLQGNAKK